MQNIRVICIRDHYFILVQKDLGYPFTMDVMYKYTTVYLTNPLLMDIQGFSKHPSANNPMLNNCVCKLFSPI